MDQKQHKMSLAREDPISVLISDNRSNTKSYVQKIMKTFCISQCMEQYTQNGLKNTSDCPKENATRYIVRLFFKYQSNIKNI